MEKGIRGLAMSGIVLLLAVVAGGGGNTEQSSGQGQEQSGGSEGSITAVGSSALQPLVEEASKQFMSNTPKRK